MRGGDVGMIRISIMADPYILCNVAARRGVHGCWPQGQIWDQA
jgi:hypothetical protein